MNEKLVDRLDQMAQQLAEVNNDLINPEIARQPDRLKALGRKRAALEPICQKYQQYQSLKQEADELEAMLGDEADSDMIDMMRQEQASLRQQADQLFEEIKGELVTSDDRSIHSVIIEIRAGVGGDEAGIWAGELLQMYERYASQQKKWRWELMQFSGAEMGGCKLAIVNLSGEGVWQSLGYEGGTHCVKRVPATESQGRIHTSTATVAILPEPEEVEIKINEADVKIDITTSQGPGGQNVNKVATAVKMFHLPTGIEVRMQDTKSQHQNRQLAWQLLKARVYQYHQKQADAERAQQRSAMIGSGERGERIRTYRYKDNIAVDHRIQQSFPLLKIMNGELGDLLNALIEHDKAKRLAAL